MKKDYKGFSTQLIHGAGIKDPYRAATVPIYQTSTFSFPTADEGARCFSGESDGFMYTRLGNPTIQALERQLAVLEGGYAGLAVSSGMAAVTSIYLSFLSSGDHFISTDAVYGPARTIVEKQLVRFGIEASYTPTTSIDQIRTLIRPNTRMLYVETPANPTLDMTDLAACSRLAKEFGLLLVVDNTFCSPYLQRPLDFGADIVFHSMTKSINGHADVVAGVVITRDQEHFESLRAMITQLGCTMDPHQAYLVLRGLKTLAIRIEKAQENAIQIAEFLDKHPKVAWLRYPGLKSHPQHELVRLQMRGPGSMISFGLKDGFEGAKRLLDNVSLAILAVSLGGVETLIQHPASMTHARVSTHDKQKAGITDDLIRLSIGIEDIEDLFTDLTQALEFV